MSGPGDRYDSPSERSGQMRLTTVESPQRSLLSGDSTDEEGPMQRSATDIGMLVLAVGVGVPFAILWAIALVDVIQRPDEEFPAVRPGFNARLVWSFAVVLLSGIGALFYYVMVMRARPRPRP